MVKKGGKKKKKSRSKTAVIDDDDGTVELNIEGDGAQLGIGKKKKKKKKKVKLTREEKAVAKLAKKLVSFQADEIAYTNFWHKMDKWMKDKKGQIERNFKHYDIEEDGVVPFHIFKAGLRDLSCPTTDLELYALSKILDPENTGLIDYTNFQAGMRQPVPDSDENDVDHAKDLLPEDYRPDVMLTKEKFASKWFGDPFQAKFPRYIGLNMKLKDFIAVPKHPGHFYITVYSHLTVSGLINKINKSTEITSGQIRVYASKNCKQEECLLLRSSLEECGFEGGSMYNPQIGTLFYDYFVEYDDCPLLNCDFYFGNFGKPKNPVLKAFPDYEQRLRNKDRKKNFANEENSETDY